jgi:hypothetical protein
MKIILIIVGLFIVSTSNSQTKKPSTPQVKPQATKSLVVKTEPEKIDTLELVKQRAQKWFKDVYVENNFKDPYSYELLKLTVEPKTFYQELQNDTSFANWDIRYEKYLLKDTLKGQFQKLKDDVVMYEEKAFKKDGKVNEKYKSLYESSLKQLNEERFKRTDSLRKVEIKRDVLVERLNTLTDEQKKMVLYYIIYLDCHANNSYGGKILGKYTFKYNFYKSAYDVEKVNSD